MDLGVQGKVALVAAASKGLGYGVARALVHEGARVSLCGRDATQVAAASRKLGDEAGAEVIGIPADVTKPDHIKAWVESTAQRWNTIDMLLCNAGGPPPGMLKDFTDEQWQAAFELTLMSTVRMIRATLPFMTHGGSILVITSSSSREPVERLGLSTVMRAGVAGLIKTMADELAGDGIRLNNLIPGRIHTDRVDSLDNATAKREGISFEDARARSLKAIPMARLGTTEEFGAAAAFLLSPAASYITGATLRIDGGMMRSI
jgi:3-oxoacyl-[acyl-carrier protein] reductase